MHLSRRAFLRAGGSVASGVIFNGQFLHASPMNQPLGFQGYEITEFLAKDWDGTWKKMASIGYKFVDLVKYGGRSAPDLAKKTGKDVRQSLDAAGLKAYNHHFAFNGFTNSFAETMQFAHDVGVQSVTSSAGPRRSTAEDWKWTAGQLNDIGAKVQKEGFFLGYHNHEVEFRPVDGQTPWDILVANTDPKLVRFQIDVGNLTFGGGNAEEYLAKYSDRYFSMHCKDFKPRKASVPVGSGDLDWNKLFAIAKRANIKSYVAEVGAYGVSSLDGAPLEPSEFDYIESYRRSFLFLDAFKNA